MGGSGSGSLGRSVTRLLASLVLAVIAAALLAGPVHAQPATLLPGVTYEHGVQFTPHGPVSIRIVRGPKPVGAYRLRTVLSNEAVLGRETVSSMQKRLAPTATMVGVNGDLWRWADGKPSGIFLRDGVLVSPPNSERSSAGFGLDGTLDVRRVKFLGTWRGTGQRRAVNELNDAPGKNGLALFTPDYGTTTPRIPGAYAVTLSPFPPSVPNTDLVAPVTTAGPGSRVFIAPGSAVLVARGNAAAKLQAEAAVGTMLTLRVILQPDWATVADAIGGGPLLVREGRPVYRANEAFTVSQLAPRHPRTAIGQTADGRVLLVVVDGRQPGYSVGMTTFEMALTMVRIGAVRAMQLDGGGSSTLAFEGRVLNRPSDGRERAISTAVMLQYFGAYLPPPAEDVVSPNGDGVAEAQQLGFKIVRPSDVRVALTAPDGTVPFEEIGPRVPGTYAVPFPPPPPLPGPVPGEPPPPDPPAPPPPAEGRWTLSVSATDDQGLSSSAIRRFAVNSTLGFLKLEPARLVLPPKGANATIRWTQTRAARVKVTVETIDGILVRVPALRRLEPGEQAVVWNGRRASGKIAAGGRYVITVEATNELGTATLEQELTVRRKAARKR
jgi:Phosphodiester glycosidase/FlgD Ig-like domain